MRKFNLIFVVAFGLLIFLPANAQQHQIGVVGGLNLAKLSSDDLEGIGFEFSNRTAFGLGGVLDLGLNKNISLRFEPMYLQKGSEFPDNEEPDVELKLEASYFEVPVLIKYAFGRSDVRPYLMAGPSLGLLLKADLVVPGQENEDIKDELQNIDLSVGVGAGISFPMGRTSFFVQGRYVLGLTNLNDSEGEGSDSEFNNRGIQFMAGITIPLGGQ